MDKRVISVLILLFGLFLSSLATVDKPNVHQKEILHQTLKALLNFNVDETSSANRPTISRSNQAISKYMNEMFKRYKSDVSGQQASNIVRSIAPRIAAIGGQEAIVFNLNALRSSEEIVRAEIHYKAGSGKKPRRQVRCYRVQSHSASDPIERVELPRLAHSDDTFGWNVFDAQPAVISISSSSPNSTRMSVVFAVESPRSKKLRVHSARKVLRHHSPFLLVFTEDSGLIDRQRIMSAVLGSEKKKEESSSEEDARIISRAKRHTDNNNQYYQYSVGDVDSLSSADKHGLTHVRAFQQQGPSVLQDTKQARRHRKLKSNRKSKYDASVLFTPKEAVPFGGESRSEGKKVDVNEIRKEQLFVSSKLRNKAKLQRNDATIVLLDDDTVDDGAAYVDVCRKHDLVVEFADIGWGDWIIAPKSFEAHYCHGACPFPLPSNANPSNHAVIQSIIHTVGLHPGVPEICCAPEKMDSLTLLYFDEEQNVVLKNYPKMTVSSCGCL